MKVSALQETHIGLFLHNRD